LRKRRAIVLRQGRGTDGARRPDCSLSWGVTPPLRYYPPPCGISREAAFAKAAAEGQDASKPSFFAKAEAQTEPDAQTAA